MKKINIAIDGFSSCGKSTLAKQIASHLGYIYIDSGAMYRAIALFAINKGLYEGGKLHSQELVSMLDQISVRFEVNSDSKKSVIHLNGEPVEAQIRDMTVSGKVSEVAAIPEVRLKLVDLQREMAKSKGVVMDGRDIGTHVLPEAEVKLFMTADPQVRAERRHQELLSKGFTAELREVYENLMQRDHEDSTRATNPLRKAPDAIEIDNTGLTHEQQFDIALQIAQKAIQQP